jgi:methyl-accepting chemotaxis protein
LIRNTGIEDSLERLDKLTQEEARMASAELLKMTSSVGGRVTGVDDRVKDVQGRVQDVRGDVQDVGNKVQGVDDRMQGIGRDVRDRLDQVNRSLSF